MKKYLKIMICSIIFILLFSVNAFAETTELTLDINGDYTNAAFSITWENIEQKASVEIISPDGTVYSKAATPDDVYETNGEAIVRIGQAAKGTWSIKVTGDNLGVIDVNAGQIPNSLVIDSFSVAKNGEKYEASYSISDCPESIQVEIFADTDSDGYDGTRVYSGNCGSTGTVELDMKGLASGEYHFYIRVSVDGISKRDYSDSVISYQNPDYTDKVEGVKGGKYNDGYYISWTCESENDDFTVYVWDENWNLKSLNEVRGEDFYYGDFDEDETKVYLAVVRTGRKCGYDKVEVLSDTEIDAAVVYDIEENVTSHNYIVADVQFSGKCTIDAYLNGEQKIEGAEEDGQYKVSMSDGDNEVIFCVTDENGNVREFVKDIYVDTVAPALAVSEDINNLITAKDYVYVSGYSEDGAVLTLNGSPVEMKKGYFNEKVKLDYGKNKIELVAEDIAGNKSVYTATVSYELNKDSRYELYVITVVVFILVILYIIVFVKGIKRRKKAQ